MQTIDKAYEHTTEVNRSKFIAHLVPISEYDGMQEQLKKEHPKANHIVYAVRTLNEYDQIVENASDAGEPKSTAGVPSLNVLRGQEIINCAVLTVRYFGGIKLGTGGLARAYAQAVKNVLYEAQLIPYEKQVSYFFDTQYNEVEKTLYLLRQLGINDYDREFGMENVKWTIRGSEAQIEKLKTMKGS